LDDEIRELLKHARVELPSGLTRHEDPTLERSSARERFSGTVEASNHALRERDLSIRPARFGRLLIDTRSVRSRRSNSSNSKQGHDKENRLKGRFFLSGISYKLNGDLWIRRSTFLLILLVGLDRLHPFTIFIFNARPKFADATTDFAGYTA
jgi:hypothetical protein